MCAPLHKIPIPIKSVSNLVFNSLISLCCSHEQGVESRSALRLPDCWRPHARGEGSRVLTTCQNVVSPAAAQDVLLIPAISNISSRDVAHPIIKAEAVYIPDCHVRWVCFAICRCG